MTTPNAPLPPLTPVVVHPVRGRNWHLPLVIGALVLLALVLFFSLTRDCSVVDGALYQSDSARTAAFERGDTLRADDPRQGTSAAARACGRR
jgi:hypothetical protein